MILVRNINCLLVSCVIYAGESGGFDGAGATGDVVNAAGEAGDVFSHTDDVRHLARSMSFSPFGIPPFGIPTRTHLMHPGQLTCLRYDN